MVEREWLGGQAALIPKPQASSLRYGIAGRVNDNLTTALWVRVALG